VLAAVVVLLLLVVVVVVVVVVDDDDDDVVVVVVVVVVVMVVVVVVPVFVCTLLLLLVLLLCCCRVYPKAKIVSMIEKGGLIVPVLELSTGIDRNKPSWFQIRFICENYILGNMARNEQVHCNVVNIIRHTLCPFF
jgi:hypothetical protein